MTVLKGGWEGQDGWIKVLAAKPTSLSLTFRTCVVEGKNKVSSDLHVCAVAYAGPPKE